MNERHVYYLYLYLHHSMFMHIHTSIYSSSSSLSPPPHHPTILLSSNNFRPPSVPAFGGEEVLFSMFVYFMFMSTYLILFYPRRQLNQSARELLFSSFPLSHCLLFYLHSSLLFQNQPAESPSPSYLVTHR